MSDENERRCWSCELRGTAGKRAKRRHQTAVKHARRSNLWAAVHHRWPQPDDAHKVKFWPMRCRCDYCTAGRQRHAHQEDPDA